MRRARALVPYASVALLVVALATFALAYAVSDEGARRDAQRFATAPATAVPTARAVIDLSRTARLAYWRGDTSAAELLVSNLDGSQRRSVGRGENVRRISLTRWTPDGDAVSFVTNGTILHVIRLDGAQRQIPLPDELVQRGYRIVDVRWSPDGSQAAATILRSELRGDVWIASPQEATWRRATTLDDAFAGDWLSNDQLLVSTGGGVIAVLDAATENALRPLTGMPATAPILAEDGRIHFVTGAITPTPRDATLPYLTASGATAWSLTVDGADLRQETSQQVDDVRLDAWLGVGRYLAHRGSSQLQVVMGETVLTLPLDAGAIERAIVSPDGRIAYGFTATRILRFDVRVGAFVSPTVFLDSVTGGDAWYPRSISLARTHDDPTFERPAARYAFALGGGLWTMGADGIASLLRARPPALAPRRGLAAPPWSPRGDRVLTIEAAGTGVAGLTAPTPLPRTVDLAGAVTDHVDGRASTNVVSWSPDGTAFAVVVDRRGVDALSDQAVLEARFLNVAGGAAREPLPARDVAWTPRGIVLLTDRALEIIDDGGRTRLVDLAALLEDPRGDFPPAAQRLTVTYANLTSSRDGTWLGLRVGVTQRNGPSRFVLVIVRASDGAVTAFLSGSQVTDPGWSPGRPLFGYSSAAGRTPAAEVRDPATGTIVAQQFGRFAGWSPDGAWYYVARQAGLFAYKVSGGDGVRISSVGAPVTTTAP